MIESFNVVFIFSKRQYELNDLINLNYNELKEIHNNDKDFSKMMYLQDFQYELNSFKPKDEFNWFIFSNSKIED